jgi:transcriptional regulator GlxA family with amidase domain
VFFLQAISFSSRLPDVCSVNIAVTECCVSVWLRMTGRRKLVIVGPEPVHVLDVTGPIEVFSNAEGYDFAIATPGHRRTLQPNRRFALSDAVPIKEITVPIDTLIVAGAPGAETGIYDPLLVTWIEDAASRSRRVASICTGAFLLGAAGLIDGKKVVTHWRFCDSLAKEFPRAVVCPEPIFLKDGNIYTSAEIVAGIDVALAMVEEDHGHQVALNIARFVVMFLVRPGGAGSVQSHAVSPGGNFEAFA